MQQQNASGPENTRFGVFGALATRLWSGSSVPGGESSSNSGTGSSRPPAPSGMPQPKAKSKSSAASALPDLSHLSADERAIIERVLERDARENPLLQQQQQQHQQQQQLSAQHTPERTKMQATFAQAALIHEPPHQTQVPRSPQQRQRTSSNSINYEAPVASHPKSASHQFQGCPPTAPRFEPFQHVQLSQTQPPSHTQLPQTLPPPTQSAPSKASPQALPKSLPQFSNRAPFSSPHRSEPEFGCAARVVSTSVPVWDALPEQHVTQPPLSSAASLRSSQRQPPATSQVRFALFLRRESVCVCVLCVCVCVSEREREREKKGNMGVRSFTLRIGECSVRHRLDKTQSKKKPASRSARPAGVGGQRCAREKHGIRAQLQLSH